MKKIAKIFLIAWVMLVFCVIVGCDENSIIITFDYSEFDGVECEEDEREIKPGEKIGKLPNAKLDGYTFSGWYTEDEYDAVSEGLEGNKVKSTFKPKEDTVLYAWFEKNNSSDIEDENQSGNGSNEHECYFSVTIDEKAATCTDSGYKITGCSECDERKTEAIPMLGHDYQSTVIAPTCKEEGYTTVKCSRCGDTQNNARLEQTVKINHTYEHVENSTVAPTCTENGYDLQKCTMCGFERKYNSVNKLGHKYEIIPFIEATCTTTGLTEGKKCSVCGDVILEQEIIPFNHSYNNGRACVKCGSLKPSEGLSFYKYDTYCYVRGMGTCTDTVVVIPSVYDGVPVISVGGFKENFHIEEVVVPDSVTQIENRAFEDCPKLKKITLGKGITKIGEYSISGCVSLEEVNIASSAYQIESHAFYDSNISSINLEGALKIGYGAFSWCENLKNVILGEGLLDIDYEAFKYCTALESLIIPKSVIEISTSVFEGCKNLSSIKCVVTSKPNGWSDYWNKTSYSKYCQVEWGYTED